MKLLELHQNEAFARKVALTISRNDPHLIWTVRQDGRLIAKRSHGSFVIIQAQANTGSPQEEAAYVSVNDDGDSKFNIDSLVGGELNKKPLTHSDGKHVIYKVTPKVKT